MPFNIGPFELLLVLILALLVLGPGKLPEVGSAIGKTLREFRRATSEVDETVKAADLRQPATAKAAAARAPAPAEHDVAELEEPPASRN
ncbi:MAG TPA: twin-arginine translocase TatA/TatE family subunit [Candidatus Limnocylindria bacterium]|nr:twin-arginine translocase TatA/TatE family subunit [Candidatus Limnocylindria bacterium]